MKTKTPIPQENFCLSPWNQIHVTPIGVVKPCCVFDGGLKNSANKSIRINDDTLENIWNSNAFKDLRLKMLNGDRIPECKKCYEEEKISNTSDRLRSLSYDESILDIIANSFGSGQVNQLPHILNLKIGNKCNLKCRMCQPLDSAMVDTEFTQLSKQDPRFRSFDNANAFDYNFEETPIEIAGNWINDPVANENLLKLLSNTDHLSLAGGEIAFTPEAINVLKFCVEKRIADKISVTMSSNLTRMDDELIKLMSSFKFFRVVASIDAVDNGAEYIRYPSKWNVIKKNLMKLTEAPKNVFPIIAPTIQIYNILDIVKVFELIEELDYDLEKYKDTPPAHLTILFDPQHLSIRHLPRKIKDIALERLLSFKKTSKKLALNLNYAEQFNLIIETLRQDNFDTFNGLTSRDYLAYFMQYTNDLDKQRGQRLQDFLPELFELLAKENIVPEYPSNNPQNYTFFKFRDAGFRLHGEGKVAEALQMFSRANEMYSEDTDLMFSMANCYMDINKREMALDIFKQIEVKKPDHFFNLVALANYSMTEGNFEEAIHYFKLSKKFAGENSQDYSDEKIKLCTDQLK